MTIIIIIISPKVSRRELLNYLVISVRYYSPTEKYGLILCWLEEIKILPSYPHLSQIPPLPGHQARKEKPNSIPKTFKMDCLLGLPPTPSVTDSFLKPSSKKGTNTWDKEFWAPSPISFRSLWSVLVSEPNIYCASPGLIPELTCVDCQPGIN